MMLTNGLNNFGLLSAAVATFAVILTPPYLSSCNGPNNNTGGGYAQLRLQQLGA